MQSFKFAETESHSLSKKIAFIVQSKGKLKIWNFRTSLCMGTSCKEVTSTAQGMGSYYSAQSASSYLN